MAIVMVSVRTTTKNNEHRMPRAVGVEDVDERFQGCSNGCSDLNDLIIVRQVQEMTARLRWQERAYGDAMGNYSPFHRLATLRPGSFAGQRSRKQRRETL